jgi:hypothetical protein
VIAASLPCAAVLVAQRIRVPAAVRQEGTGASRGRSLDCPS